MKRLIVIVVFLLLTVPAKAFSQLRENEKQSSWLSSFATNVSPVTRTADGKVDYVFTAIVGTWDALQYVDLALTYHALTQKLPEGIELREGNPLMRPFVKNPPAFIVVKTGLTLFGNYCVKEIYKESPLGAYIVAGAGMLISGFVVYHNYQISVAIEF